jgi:hypothetical protein
VILYTAYEIQEIIDKASQLGLTSFVSKKDGPFEVLKQIKTLLANP